ncbi:MAG: VOC family protein [Candidatus Binataceae bacterium]|jgi:catechol 2,3-dioxygenase-like lactoylglutathione lyase family enzyme
MFKAFKFNHVAVNVTDVDKSREFYEKVIGLKKLPRPKINIPGEWYGLGESAIHLIGGERRKDGIDPTGPHMAIQVDDIDRTKASLEEMGVKYLDAAVMMAKMNLTPEQQKMVGRQVWVKDPDGNVIELQERTAE